MDFKSPDSVLLVLFLFSIILFPILNIRTVSAAQALDPTSVNITKSLSTNNLSKSTSIVILLKINKQGNGLVKQVTITDVIPPMFTGEPKELFKDNVLQKHLAILNDSDFFSYSVSLKTSFDLSKDWTFAMPSAQVTYKVDNYTEIKSANSNSPNLTLLSKPNTDWKSDLWPFYVIILISIAIGSGAVGGTINFVLKYRSGNRSIVSKKEIINPSYKLEVEYTNYIEVGDTCNIKVSSYSPYSPPATDSASTSSAAPHIKCDIFVKGLEEFTFPIGIGQDDQHKEVKEVSYVINDKDAYLKIKDGPIEVENIKINVTKRSLGRDVGAGAAAGSITLLALITTTTAISGNPTWVSLDTYPQNVQSMITLFVTCFIAGLVPFQILDKATGQLVDTIKITRDEVKNKEKITNNLRNFVSIHLTSLKTLLPTKPNETIDLSKVQGAVEMIDSLKKSLDTFI